MDSKELRIGNWVSWLDGSDNFETTTSSISNSYSCKPIPLNEDWLVKFGFAQYKDPESIYYSKEFEGLFNFDLRRSFGFPNFIWEFNDMPLFVDYVHQLQNLYFALTGEELTIKTN
jgi:hypothetical protein